MIAVSTLQTDLYNLTEKLIKQLSDFPASVFNKAPSAQSWSAAEVAEHLLIIAKNINRSLRAEGTVADRPIDKKVAPLKAALQDMETKRMAPETVKPKGDSISQNILISELQQQMELLNEVVEEKELTELCTVYPHPVAGRLTRLEWIYFIIYHTERHLLQLEEIKKAVVH